MGIFDSIGNAVSSFTKSVGNDVSSVGQGIGNFATQGLKAIGGFYGFDSNGNWTNSGGVFKWMDEGLGEVTGRNESRAALNLATDQFDYAQSQAQGLINQQNWNNQNSATVASQTAGAARAGMAATSGTNYSNATPLAMGPSYGMGAPGGKDFLGL